MQRLEWSVGSYAKIASYMHFAGEVTRPAVITAANHADTALAAAKYADALVTAAANHGIGEIAVCKNLQLGLWTSEADGDEAVRDEISTDRAVATNVEIAASLLRAGVLNVITAAGRHARHGNHACHFGAGHRIDVRILNTSYARV